MNFITKPSKDNIKTYVPIGLSLVSLSFLDVFVNAFFALPITVLTKLQPVIPYDGPNSSRFDVCGPIGPMGPGLAPGPGPDLEYLGNI